MKIIQITLIFILLLVCFVFYKNYIKKTDNVEEKPLIIESSLITNEKNLIKNLSYEVNLPNNKLYKISAATSELVIENNVELMKMVNVQAVFLDDKKKPLNVEANSAIYDTFNYKTEFKDNIIVKYLDKLIFSDNMELDFQKNILILYNNVKYKDQKYEMFSDKILIDLINGNIDINMFEENKNIEFKNIN